MRVVSGLVLGVVQVVEVVVVMAALLLAQAAGCVMTAAGWCTVADGLRAMPFDLGKVGGAR